jgi:lipopolysaccharide export system protein LptA
MHKNLKGLSTLLFLMTTAVYALPSDNTQLMHVTSARMYVNATTGIAQYTGSVVGHQGTRHLTGHQATLYRNKKTGHLQKIKVTGNLAHYSYLPNPHKARVYGQGKTIYYLPNKDQLQLIDKAQVSQDGNVSKGPKILYNTDSRTIVTPLSNKGRTTMILKPYDQNKKAGA